MTSILPHSVLTTLAFPVEQLHPAAPPLVPPDPERLTSYFKLKRELIAPLLAALKDSE